MSGRRVDVDKEGLALQLAVGVMDVEIGTERRGARVRMDAAGARGREGRERYHRMSLVAMSAARGSVENRVGRPVGRART